MPGGKGRAKAPAGAASSPTAFARLQSQLKAVDVLFEVRDARLPATSAHPQVSEIFGNKPRLIVLAKQDLADARALRNWLDKLNADDRLKATAVALKAQKGQRSLIETAIELHKHKQESLARKGLLPRPVRICVVGLPNVGKSTLVNWLVGRHKAPTGDRPGITRAAHWIRIHPQIELLDTPGILPPYSFSGTAALKLALCNVLPADRCDVCQVAEFGLDWLIEHAPESLDIYGPQFRQNRQNQPSLESLAAARSCLAVGGKPDMRRAAAILLNDFRSGKLGRHVLDTIDAG